MSSCLTLKFVISKARLFSRTLASLEPKRRTTSISKPWQRRTPQVMSLATGIMSSSSLASLDSAFPVRAYQHPSTSWPYSASDFSRQDESADTAFYAPARLVTHIDDNAIKTLSRYYSATLPRQGNILEICSSWVSHFPSELAEAARQGAARAGAVKNGEEPLESDTGTNDVLLVTGYGMNAAELDTNPILARRVVRDLNVNPRLDETDGTIPNTFDAALCVVSIDYLTRPREVLEGVLRSLKPGASMHLTISNRCFPTKAILRWLHISEQERLDMVADYLCFSGFVDVEVVTLVDNISDAQEGGLRGWFLTATKDPLWVVRGKKPGADTSES